MKQTTLSVPTETKNHSSNNNPNGKTLSPSQINAELDIEPGRCSIAVKESEAEFIYDFLKEHNCQRTLEVGMGYARSATHILAATGRKHIGMDPFQSDYDNHGLKNIKKLGLDENFEFHADFSHNVLPKLHQKDATFDFIFIDGDHKFDGIFVDFYYADLMLEEGGYILFHDTWMRSTQMVRQFIKTNRKDYKFIDTGLRNLCMIRKVDIDTRNGMHCREFYTTKNLLVHHAIMWISEGKDTPLKRAATWLKDKVK